MGQTVKTEHMEQLKQHHEFSGIILAGGKSSRMGTDKASLCLNGKSFLDIQIEKLRRAGAGEILISCRSSSPEGPALSDGIHTSEIHVDGIRSDEKPPRPGTDYRSCRIPAHELPAHPVSARIPQNGSLLRRIPDLIPDCGPLGGMYSCFSECRFPFALVLSVDTPLLTADTLIRLLDAHIASPHDATVLSFRGRIQPLIAVYRTDTAGILRELIRQKKLAVRAFLDRLDCQFIEYHGDEKELLNCNTKEDLTLFQA